MTDTPAASHWSDVWDGDAGTERSWFEATPARSLSWILDVAGPQHSVVDVGGGASPLVDHLLERGFLDVAVVDIAEEALAHSRDRLGARATDVRWQVSDVRLLDLGRTFDVWHDRAVLHFLREDVDRRSWVEALERHVAVGGHAVLATFAPTGPTHCSGLEVRRHSADDLVKLLGEQWSVRRAEEHVHDTPAGTSQDFTWATFQRVA